MTSNAAPSGPVTYCDVLARERAVPRPEGIAADAPLSALCISGGGIRSATFALGAIQAMAKQGLLSQFDYLSTVSGGGFIGSWLSAWAKRSSDRIREKRSSAGIKDEWSSDGIKDVTSDLCTYGAANASNDATSGRPAPVEHLREYNHYLTPRSGAFSADMWTLLATIFRNIVLNWLVLIPLVMFVLMVPRLSIAALSIAERKYGHMIYVQGQEPDWSLPILNAISDSFFVSWGLRGIAAALLAVALFYTLRFLPGVGNVKHSRFQFNARVLAPLVGAMCFFLAYDTYFYMGTNYNGNSSVGALIVWTLVPCGIAWAAAFMVDSRPLLDRIKLFIGLALALALLGAATALSVWLVTNVALWDSRNPESAPSWAFYVTFGPSAALFSFVIGIFFFVGLSSRFLHDDAREWLSRCAGIILLYSVGWTGLCAVVLMLPEWGMRQHAVGHISLAAVAGASAWISKLGGSAPAASDQGAKSKGSRMLKLVPMLAPVVFLVLLGGALSVVTNMLLLAISNATSIETLRIVSAESWVPVEWTNHYVMIDGAHPYLIGLVMMGFLAVAVVASRYININTFSLNGMYRDRLVRAYLGASNRKRREEFSPFTGLAPHDDMPVAELRTQRPLHVLNLTLNLTDDSRLAWQQRKATSFTVSPLHCGSAELGYRPSEKYAAGISLGTAMAISGAAASPNMGYHSSPVVGFIMTLFNARLGAWLGNPGTAGDRTWEQSGPRSAVRAMIKEALGQTSDKSEYVYLSDGGHFENLGLYEMVRRRCLMIVVLDGGCDPDFSYDDLGNAMRKIRIDFGIPIDFDKGDIQPLRDKKERYALGTVRYSAVNKADPDGRILYVKPIILGTENPDVLSYAAANPTFPHQSTSDQSFNEAQTESYRALGWRSIRDLCGDVEYLTLAELFTHASRPAKESDRESSRMRS